MKALLEHEAEKLLSRYVPVAKSVLTKNAGEAKKAGKKLGYPIVLKLISPQAIHKTEFNGVRIVRNESELEKNYSDLLSTAKRKGISLKGILAQEFVEGKELIIGLKKDATFGHLVLVGFGGIMVEVLRDYSLRICPISLSDAQEMLDELKAKQLLYGFRGQKPLNLKLLKQVLVSVSRIPLKHKNISELDINPFILSEKQGKVADARIVFE